MAAETSLGEADSSNGTKDNKFVCDGCGSVLKQTSALYHIRNVCENVGVDCPTCELSFISQRDMEMHNVTQHGE